MPRAGKMKECSRRPRETDHVSTTCGEAHSSPEDPGYGVSTFFLALLTKRPRNAREAAVRGRGNVTRERQRL